MQNFESSMDSFTRGIARDVHCFFKEKGMSFSSDEELQQEFFNYLQKSVFIKLSDLKVEVKTIEGGYRGFVKTTPLSQPLFFEIFSNN